MEKYLPNERKQCELIWKPVYEEYRRRIRTLEYQNKELEKRIIELQTKHGEVVSVEYYSDFDEVK